MIASNKRIVCSTVCVQCNVSSQNTHLNFNFKHSYFLAQKHLLQISDLHKVHLFQSDISC